MSSSTPLLDLLTTNAQQEPGANELFNASSPATLFARRESATSGLTWGYYGGVLWVDGVLTAIANGTVALSASTTNYVERTRAGVVSKNTTGFTAGSTPLYTIVTGSATITQHDSFTEYLAKHSLTETEVWADINKDSITAVINAHSAAPDPDDEGTAGWGDHRATLQLVTTQDWRDWTGNNGKLVGQQEFAEFVEQHLPNFLRPSAADMLELAQTIKGHTKVSFESSKRVKSGETAIEWREDTTAAAGKKGTLEIPDTIDLGMQVYEGGVPYKLTARFRYRIGGGTLLLGYVLERAGDVKRDAFGQVVGQVATDTGCEVWHGTP